MGKIGGFFALQLPERKVLDNILSLWDIPHQPHLFFANARSALHQLLVWQKPSVLWLPAYCCTSLADGARGVAAVQFYPLSPSLSPDGAYLNKHVKAGDAVLAIDYFGRSPDAEFLTFAAASSDVTFIEDRAQAMHPAKTAWGDFILYSPRKLLGVPDGGILVSAKQPLPSLNQPPLENMDFIAPSLMRYADAAENNNDQWYAAFKEAEKSMSVSNHSMSPLSQRILQSIDPHPLMEKRKANYKTLMDELRDIALLPEDDDSFVPFGFPVRLKSRKEVAHALHSKGIFAAHHWPELPSDPEKFSAEHALAAQLLTLPVDQRYGGDDMKYMSALVREVI